MYEKQSFENRHMNKGTPVTEHGLSASQAQQCLDKDGPNDAAVHALQAVAIQVQVRSYEERSTRASSNASDAQTCAFLELVAAAVSGADRFFLGTDSAAQPR